jgi:hypothetical protein
MRHQIQLVDLPKSIQDRTDDVDKITHITAEDTPHGDVYKVHYSTTYVVWKYRNGWEYEVKYKS